MRVELRPVLREETELGGFDGTLLHCTIIRDDDADEYTQLHQRGEQHEDDQHRICYDAAAAVQGNATRLVVEAAIR